MRSIRVRPRKVSPKILISDDERKIKIPRAVSSRYGVQG